MEFYILQIGKKYYHWNMRRQAMTLDEDICYAYQFKSLDELKTELEYLEKEGKYKRLKRRVLHVKCEIEEIEI